jgi:hypothetical protein
MNFRSKFQIIKKPLFWRSKFHIINKPIKKRKQASPYLIKEKESPIDVWMSPTNT